MRKIYLFLSLSILIYEAAIAQKIDIHYNVQAMGSYTSPNHIPFWIRSNKNGVIPLDNASLNFAGSIRKEYSGDKSRLFDWGAGFEGWTNVGNKSTFYLTEGYAKVRLSIFELKAGRSKEITGLCDTSLSSGAFAVSGNALGIPQIEISIPEFYSIPVFGKLFAFKGNYVHGWIGDLPVNMLDRSVDSLKKYLHQLSVYGQLGKPGWKIKLYGGINHVVQWGSESEYYGSNYTLTGLQCYWYVISGKPYKAENIPTSKIGNHLGSIDLGFEYNFINARLFAYHQFFYDIGAIGHFANLRDGLSGLSITNRNSSSIKTFKWTKVLVEFFYSKNQAGEFSSKYSPSGDENYYNNGAYVEGWSYKQVGLGNAFICTSDWTRSGLPATQHDYFINNRVVALHFGFEGSLKNLDFILKASYSLNYGTFGTSEEGHSLGSIHFPPIYGIFPETRQFSSYMEVNKELKRRLKLGVIGAFDVGDLYYNSVGLQLRLSKSF